MPVVSHFDDETAIRPDGDDAFVAQLSTDWNIGETANGGYALSPVLRALREITGQPDALSLTTHFLRPVQGGGPATITTETIRRGRTVSVARGTLHHAGSDRLVVTAAMGDLGPGDGADVDMAADPPPIDAPSDCVARSGDHQGVVLPITSRVEVRLPAHRMQPGGSDDAVTEGWIRLVDGSAPTTTVLPLFADAFPPSLLSKLGRVGWVPTIELTVHVRRRPVSGWIQARFECDDLADGRMIESGTLWDESGRVVARSRQLGLLLT